MRIIRPFIHVRDKWVKQYAISQMLPANYDNGHIRINKQRQRARQLLAQQEIVSPNIFSNLRGAIQQLQKLGETGTEMEVSEAVD